MGHPSVAGATSEPTIEPADRRRDRNCCSLGPGKTTIRVDSEETPLQTSGGSGKIRPPSAEEFDQRCNRVSSRILHLASSITADVPNGVP
jgi:hypothetical protein